MDSNDTPNKAIEQIYEVFNETCHDEVIGDAIRWILARA